MNINDFLLTVIISSGIGLLLGYFIRDLVNATRRFYHKHLKRSRYFELDTSATNTKKLK
ncbi:hypothetical protein QPB21_003545 [Vibrio alginolyticus]|jgi:hypothetical protein|uniref:Uncharacterized protein n=2 Tax=Vibrio alginolyticus TaxID=663 RepID=A0A7Y0MZW9_VIBAL|nr:MULTISPECIES: hypothetical protein [Vibrio]MDW1808125.1 hypothetical protein [Vibrio sp. Vb2362]GAJ71058.1 hypothetical protein JCM18904_1799 [Vibrio sp. JCM 18904]AGV18761.1 hypothetical protein N646_2951 [Vibrio alginolyticus NBRC 15630 = ATCC 17749]EIF2705521.1 hypothetical protein [Vibrio alginolyticus]EIJ2379668.1 hypothetical protein [Vibrio alginolyticus]